MTSMQLHSPSMAAPGSRTEVVRLRVARELLPALLEGQSVAHVQLVPSDDGTHVLRCATTVGAARGSGHKPAVDELVEEINGFSQVLDQHEYHVPNEVLAAFEALVNRWNSRGRS